MTRTLGLSRTLVVLLALTAGACATASADAETSAEPPVIALALDDADAPGGFGEPTVTSTTTTTTIAPTTTIPNPNETLVATARPSIESLVAYEEPDGERITLPFRVPNPHQFGGPLTLMVTEGARDDDWLKVQLPIRPNGTEGWIQAKDYHISSTLIRAEVELSTTSVRVFENGVLIAESQAAIGADETPTPLGTFFVAAKRLNPPAEAHLGPWALVLSSFSETLPTFSGALPVIAIHGSNNPDSVLGRAISNGCVRVPNDVIEFLADHVPRGTPVTITA